MSSLPLHSSTEKNVTAYKLARLRPPCRATSTQFFSRNSFNALYSVSRDLQPRFFIKVQAAQRSPLLLPLYWANRCKRSLTACAPSAANSALRSTTYGTGANPPGSRFAAWPLKRRRLPMERSAAAAIAISDHFPPPRRRISAFRDPCVDPIRDLAFDPTDRTPAPKRNLARKTAFSYRFIEGGTGQPSAGLDLMSSQEGRR